MKNIRYIQDHPIFNEKYWDINLKNKINELLINQINSFCSDQLDENIEKLNKEIDTLKIEFKNNYNPILAFFLILGVIFGFILIIVPGVFALRKYKKLKGVKEDYLFRISEKQKEKRILIRDFIKTINFYDIKNEIFLMLGFNNFFPLSIEFLDEINYLNKENSRHLPKHKEYNSGNTTWTIFNNSIIIKKNDITHKIINKKYVGSKTVYTTTDVNGEERTLSETVYSEYYHPFPVFKNKSKYFLFLESCDELNFRYIGFNEKRRSRRNKNTALENETFSHHYNYEWNNDIQIRMLFTPFFMEAYLDINNQKAPPLELQLNKRNKFLFTNKSIPNFSLNISDLLNSRIDYLTLNEIKDHIINRLYEFSKMHYDQIIYTTIIPIVHSESHIHNVASIINKTESNKNTFSKENETFKIHYFLNEYFSSMSSFQNIDVFHDIVSINQIQTEKFLIIDSTISTLTYDVIKKTIVQKEFSSLLSEYVLVDIDYDDYIERNIFHNLMYTNINNTNNLYYLNKGFSSNLNEEILHIIEDFKTINSNIADLIIHKNNLICIFTVNESDIQNEEDNDRISIFQLLLNQIFPLINN